MTLAATQPLAAGSAADDSLSPQRVDECRRAFAGHGYVLLPGSVPQVLAAELRANILAEFERASATDGLFSGGGLLTGHLNCFPGSGARAFYEVLVQRGIVDLIRTLFPKAARLPNVGCNLNLPGSVAQHYHADRPFTNEFVIANVALVDTDVANGAIDLLPGTQLEFQRYWRFALRRTWRRSTRIAMKQGDVLIRSSNLWHRGMPNGSQTPRPMLAFTWEDGGSVLEDPFAPEQGKIVFRPNWYRPDLLGRMRERTFLAAPITYDAFRFVRSLFTDKGFDH